MRRLLVPKLEIGRWGGDGMHSSVRAPGLTTVDGWAVEIAWLGLHFEFVVAVERAV